MRLEVVWNVASFMATPPNAPDLSHVVSVFNVCSLVKQVQSKLFVSSESFISNKEAILWMIGGTLTGI